MGKCVAEIPDCEWGQAEALHGMNYAKQDEILTRHLRWHQVMETKRLADALIGFVVALRQPPQATVRLSGGPPARETEIPDLPPPPSPRCTECGFRIDSQLHRERHGVTA